MIAKSILQAASAMGGFRIPVVVRLQGTNSESALKMVGHYVWLRGQVEQCANLVHCSLKRQG